MRVIFLDDSEARIKTFLTRVPSAQVARTSWECIELLKGAESPVEFLFLDHDLGGLTFVSPSCENTGMEVVRWMAANKPVVQRVIVHSLNGPAASEMCRSLADAGYWVRRVPYLQLSGFLTSQDALPWGLKG